MVAMLYEEDIVTAVNRLFSGVIPLSLRENVRRIKLRACSCDTCVRQLGQTSSLSPWCDMKSLYFDDSLYENEMHYKIAQYLDENPLDDEYEELRINCSSAEEYNSTLDALFKAGEGKLKMYAEPNNPMEIIVEKDPRDKYRKFDENMLMEETVS